MTYELGLPEEDHVRKQNGNQCPNCGKSVKPGAVLCINCGFNMSSGQKVKTKVGSASNTKSGGKPIHAAKAYKLAARHGVTIDLQRKEKEKRKKEAADSDHHWKEISLPWILFAASWAVLTILCVIKLDSSNLIFGMLELVIEWGLKFVIYLLALLTMNKFMGTHMGTIRSMLTKLAALPAVMMALKYSMDSIYYAIGGELGTMCIGTIITLVVLFVAFYVMCEMFFEMEGAEPIIFYFLSVITSWGLTIAIGMLSLGLEFA